MATRNGRFAKVQIFGNTVALMGTFTIDGLGNDFVETTAFGDIAKHYQFTMQSYGTIKFDGFWDMSDTNGQLLLWNAFKNQTLITALKAWVDSTSGYVLDITGDSSSALLVTSCSPITFNKADVGKISFTAQVSGVLALV